MRIWIVMFLVSGAARAQQNGASLCAGASTQADAQECTRAVAGRRVDRAAVDLCRRVSTSRDVVECAYAVAGHSIDAAAVRSCSRVSTSHDVVQCAHAIADKGYDPSELSMCDRSSTSAGVVSCMRESGRRWAPRNNNQWQGNNNWQGNWQNNNWQNDPPRVSAAGTWRSTSGNMYTIPPSDTEFDIVCRFREGGKALYQGHWVRGRRGQQFYWDDPNSGHRLTATFQQGNSDSLRVDDEDSGRVFWWVRM